MMLLAGFADEAADGVAGQVRVTTRLGWKWIEARNVDGVNVHDLGDREFEEFRSALEKAEIGVCCLGSSIANWGRSVDEDFAASLAVARKAAARMKALGTRLVRIMSYRRSPARPEEARAFQAPARTLFRLYRRRNDSRP
jgi:sugar phosphate isomerase/epimerase